MDQPHRKIHDESKADEHLRSEFQHLANQIGISTGQLDIMMHEGRIPYVEIKPVFRVNLKRIDPVEPDPRMSFVRLDEVRPLVESRLEERIRNRIGRFGVVEIKVENAIVREWQFISRHKFKPKQLSEM